MLAAQPVTITFSATVSEEITLPHTIVNRAWIDDGQGTVWQRLAVAIANGQAIYLPVVRK